MQKPSLSLVLASILLAAPASAAEQSLLGTLSQEAPNASAWVLAPLEQPIPEGIRQNLTILREDLVDEGKQNSKAGLDAYRSAVQLCNTMIAALDERDQRLVRAGYRTVQAATITQATTEAVASATQSNPSINSTEVRRSYRTNWPQYARERLQRKDLLRVGEAVDKKNVQMAVGQLKVEWSDRTSMLRRNLDVLYSHFRESLRQTSFQAVVVTAKPLVGPAPDENRKDSKSNQTPSPSHPDTGKVDAAAIATLPPEDQEIIKNLKFSNPETAPRDTRHWTYIKDRITVLNAGQRSVVGKLTMESRMLFRDNEKIWTVVKTGKGKFDVKDSGNSTIQLDHSPVKNKIFATLEGGKDAKLQDFYTVVRYDGVTIFETTPKALPSFPKDWWKDAE